VTALPIDGIRFEFDDSWLIAKWDDSVWYRERFERLKGTLDGKYESTKAVDVVGMRDDVPYLFEVKDFRGFAIENKARHVEELPLELGLKARDTVAGLLGVTALGVHDDLPARWIRAVNQLGRAVNVVAWIAEDATRPGEHAHKRAVRESQRLRSVKQRLAWLTHRVWVSDPLRSPVVPGVVATSLPGAGPARRT
jgi:hypothetical protein